VRRGALRTFDNAVTRWLLVVAADAVELTLMGFLSSATCSVKRAFNSSMLFGCSRSLIFNFGLNRYAVGGGVAVASA
jgi:hypothetical protein